MPHEIVNGRKRAIMARQFIEYGTAVCAAHLMSNKFGAHAGDVVLLAAIMSGQYEGRALTATKLSSLSGIPRTTVIRRLADLESRGIISMKNRRAHLRLDVTNSAHVVGAMAKVIHRQIVLAKKLSDMDG